MYFFKLLHQEVITQFIQLKKDFYLCQPSDRTLLVIEKVKILFPNGMIIEY